MGDSKGKSRYIVCPHCYRRVYDPRCGLYQFCGCGIMITLVDEEIVCEEEGSGVRKADLRVSL